MTLLAMLPDHVAEVLQLLDTFSGSGEQVQLKNSVDHPCRTLWHAHGLPNTAVMSML